MSDQMNEIIELGSDVDDAIDYVEHALLALHNMLIDDQSGEPLPWKEMQGVRTMLELVLIPLKNTAKVLEPIVRGAEEVLQTYEDSADYQNQMGSKFQPNSY